MVEKGDTEFWKNHKSFKSIAEFCKALSEYQAANFCLFVKKRSDLNPNDETTKYLSLTMKCKQFGDPRPNEKLTGKRVHQKTYATGCTAYLKLTYSRRRKKLVLTEYQLTHNHPCNAVTYGGYPEIRRLNAAQIEKTKEFQKAKVIPSVIRPLLKEIDSNPSKIILGRDVSNVKTKARLEERQGRSDEEMLQAKLQEIIDKDPDAHVKICADDKGNVQFVFIQSSDMRRLYQKFPEVIVMDLTYKINRNAMPVLVVEIMDGDGIGEPIAYGFVANELKETLSNILEELVVSSGKLAMEKTKVVVIDKDFSEIAALKLTFPHAAVHICSVHVENVFKKYVSDEAKDKKPEVLECMKGMLKSANDAEFQMHYESFTACASSHLKDKFDNNWLAMKQMWSLKDKHAVLSLRNYTTNRVESHNQKLKLYLNSETPLYKAISDISSIILANRKDERLYRQHEILTKRVIIHKCADSVVNDISNDLTEFASKVVLQQLTLLKKEQPDCTDVEVTGTACSCELFSNLGLQCRHIMMCRKKAGLPIYSKDISLRRWHQSYQVEEQQVDGLLSGNVDMVHNPRMPGGPIKRVVTPREKFKEVVPLTLKLNTHVTSCGSKQSKQYHQRLQVLKDLDENWSSGIEVIVVPVLQKSIRDTLKSNDQSPVHSSATTNAEQNDRILLQKISAHGKPSGQHRTLHGPRKYSSKKKTVTPSNNNVKEKQVRCHVCDREVASPFHCEKCKKPVHSRVCAELSSNKEYLICFHCSESESSKSINSEVDETIIISSDDGSVNYSSHTFVSQDIKAEQSDGGASSFSITSGGKETNGQSDNNSQILNSDDALSSSTLSTGEKKKNGRFNSQIINSDDESSSSSSTSLQEKKKKNGQNVHSPINYCDEESHNKEKRKSVPFQLNTVRTKGRPKAQKGLKPKWTYRDLLEKKVDESDPRLQRGLKIKDTDITVEEYGWSVRSQTSSSGKPYKVRKVLDSCHECVCDPCIHVLACECKDHVNRNKPCKHIYKVADFVERKGVCAQSKSVLPSSAGNQDSVPLRKCNICDNFGKPTREDSAHHCFSCGEGVHNFGCSIEVPGEEGYGSRNRQCWDCYDKGGTTKLVQNLENSTTLSQKADTSQNPEQSYQSIPNGMPPFKVPFCPGCGNLLEGRVCKGTVKTEDKGRIFYRCYSGKTAKCRSIHRWEPNNVRHSRISQANKSADSSRDFEGNTEQDLADVKPNLQPVKTTPGQVIDLTFSEDEEDQNNESDESALPWQEQHLNFPNWAEMGSIYSCHGHTFTKFAFETLKEGEFLDDNIIDVFITLLIEECSDSFVEIYNLTGSTIAVTTIGMTCFLEDTANSPIIFNDLWIVPSNIEFCHWVLFLVFIKKKQIVVLDPLRQEGLIDKKVREHLQIVRYFLDRSHMHCLDGEGVDWEEWSVYSPSDFPRQPNGTDCGTIIMSLIYSLCCGKMLDSTCFTEETLLSMRKYVCNLLLSKSALIDARPPSKQTPEQANISQKVYNSATAAIQAGNQVVNKVWEVMDEKPVRVMYSSPVPGKSTIQVIAEYLPNIFNATEEKCGISEGCQLKGANKMYLCELCRDWYHLTCVGDKRLPPPEGSELPYLCPKHLKGRTRTRKGLKKPIRLRVSIG